MNRRVTSTIVVLVVLAASIGGFLTWRELIGSAQQPNATAKDGPTLYQALAAVNATIQQDRGAPWALFSYIGIAAELSFNPGVFGFIANGTGLSLAGCERALNGVTIWNGSAIPVFQGGIASGTAPFWQFEFYSATARSVIVASVIRNTAEVFPPINSTSSCWPSAGGPEAASYVSWVNPLPVDTPIQAQNAYTALGGAFHKAHPSLTEIFANGYTPLGDAFNHGPGGGAQYLLCGQPGFAGMQAKGVVGEWSNGTVQNVFQGLLSCTGLITTSPPYVYAPLAIGAASGPVPINASAGFSAESFSILAETFVNNSTYTDDWGFESWMVSLSLRNASNQTLPSVPLSCQTWVPSLTNCTSSGSGWSVVLESADGSWLDSYPSPTNSSSWAALNVVIANGERLVVILPAQWNPSGEVLSCHNTYAVPVVSGTIDL